MRILITGSKGQLGTELMLQGQEHDLIGVDVQELDISDEAAVFDCVASVRPDVVINAAAYTAVDRAENESGLAYAVNRDGPSNLAKACEKRAIPLVHVSTDYVFDGTKSGSYFESDQIAPLGVYGASKADGENQVRHCCSRHLIFRTSWVFSAHGHNFVKTMLRLGAERETLAVVADQFGKPTSAAELARVILMIVYSGKGDCWGTYHLAQPDAVSWYDFANAIFTEFKAIGGGLRLKQVNPIATEQYPTPARRPANSMLNCDRVEKTFGVVIRPWQLSLRDVVRQLNTNL